MITERVRDQIRQQIANPIDRIVSAVGNEVKGLIVETIAAKTLDKT
jgi:hypothetical protein